MHFLDLDVGGNRLPLLNLLRPSHPGNEAGKQGPLSKPRLKQRLSRIRTKSLFMAVDRRPQKTHHLVVSKLLCHFKASSLALHVGTTPGKASHVIVPEKSTII